jgi:hypothetical protein
MAKYPGSADGGVYDFEPINIETDGKLSKSGHAAAWQVGGSADGGNVRQVSSWLHKFSVQLDRGNGMLLKAAGQGLPEYAVWFVAAS